MEWTLRVIYAFACACELFTVFAYYPQQLGAPSPWTQGVTLVMAAVTGALLFQPIRQMFSHVFSAIEFVVGGQLFVALFRKFPFKQHFQSQRIFVASSIPHMNGLWIYVTTLCALLSSINPENFQMPMIGIPFPVPLDSLFSYNLFGLIVLAAAGVGIFVTRKPKETLARLGLVKPQAWHLGIAFLTVLATFGYDWLWGMYHNGPQAAIGQKLSQYNAGTFSAGGGAGPSFVLALATAVCAGIGEETLMRGALQPVFGILPAGILHGALHGQFNHMPLIIIQIAIWSTGVGIVRKYTNTTTTIIAHGTYNLINTFLFAFNP
jgi:membrane protease YdiL (CAAX protease family)